MTSHLRGETLLQNGKYRIVRFIKSGGFGCTYEAENTYFEERVAIKEFFVRDFCNRDENTAHITVGTQSKKGLVGKLKSKFIDEAKALYRLRHPGIVHVSDIFEENGTAYYVMDYIDGCSLDVYLQQNGPLPEAEALGYIRQVCDALKYVHSLNRLHLDIKPGNIMLVKDSGKVILIDFGTAKQYDECSGENTSTLLGSTPGYAPPEQANTKITQFFPATDIYALGATLYKLLTGITPLTANERSSGEELDPLPESVSESTRRAVEQALLLPKLKRTQTIDDFLTLLDADSQADEGDGEEVAADDAGAGDSESDTTEIYGEGEPAPKGEVIADEEAYDETCDEYGDDEGDEEAYDKTLMQTDSDDQPDSPGSSCSPSQPSGPAAKPVKMFRSWVWWVLAGLVAIGAVLFMLKLSSDESGVYDPTGYHEGYGYVDLGLPSGLKWSTCNVGASTPGDYGNYYAWGETSTKTEYYSSNSASYGKSWSDIGGSSSRDAARANWGGSWRLPTRSEFQELIDNCTWTWTEQNGHKGYKVTSKKNSQSIFLPAAGCRGGDTLYNDGEDGLYWSSAPFESFDDSAYDLYFREGYRSVDWSGRYYGRSVRPVLED